MGDAFAVMVAVLWAVTLLLAVNVMVPPAVFGLAAAAAAWALACAGVCAVKVRLASGLLGADGVALLATLMMVVVPCPAAVAALAILVLRTAALGAMRLITLTAGVMPVATVFTLAAFAATLLLATVAATAVASWAA